MIVQLDNMRGYTAFTVVQQSAHCRKSVLEKEQEGREIPACRTHRQQHAGPTLYSLGYIPGKETWAFTSTETIKAYYGRGSWGVGNLYI